MHLLTERKMDPNDITKDQFSPLQIACLQGYEDIVEILCKQPTIKLNLVTEAIGTALHAASANGHYKIVQSLLMKNANFRTKDLLEQSAQDVAKDSKIAKLLQKYEDTVSEEQVLEIDMEEGKLNEIEEQDSEDEDATRDPFQIKRDAREPRSFFAKITSKKITSRNNSPFREEDEDDEDGKEPERKKKVSTG